MEKRGEIDADLLNQTISMTRSHGIFQECFISSPTENETVENETNYIVKSGCHRILPEYRPESVSDNYHAIFGIMETQLGLGPLILCIASVTIVFEACAEVNDDQAFMFSLLNAVFRTIMIFFSFIFLLCSAVLGNRFRIDDPAFPVPWPKAIRATTQIDVWQPGLIRYVIAILFQMILVGLNFKRTR